MYEIYIIKIRHTITVLKNINITKILNSIIAYKLNGIKQN